MPLRDIYLVSPKLHAVDAGEITALEAKIGFALPLGYRDYLLTLGSGNFCHQLHVRTPAEVLNPAEMSYWTECLLPVAIEEGFWEEGALLSPSEMRNSIVFASSDEGDVFISCPERPGQLFELPRHESRMHHYPHGFLEPFKFEFCRLGDFNMPFFEPSNCRQIQLHLKLDDVSDMRQFWEYLEQFGPSQLRIAEGEIGKTDRVIAFVPSISGCDWLEKDRLYFFTDSEHIHDVNDLRKTFEHIVVE